MNRWSDVVALAREIDASLTAGAPVEPDKARSLAKLVLALGQEPTRTDGHVAAARRGPAQS